MKLHAILFDGVKFEILWFLEVKIYGIKSESIEHVATYKLYSVIFGLRAKDGHVCTLLDFIDSEKMSFLLLPSEIIN